MISSPSKIIVYLNFFLLVAEHTDMSFLLAIQHTLILWQPVTSSDQVTLLCYDPSETISLCTVGLSSTLFTIKCY